MLIYAIQNFVKGMDIIFNHYFNIVGNNNNYWFNNMILIDFGLFHIHERQLRIILNKRNAYIHTAT